MAEIVEGETFVYGKTGENFNQQLNTKLAEWDFILYINNFLTNVCCNNRLIHCYCVYIFKIFIFFV